MHVDPMTYEVASYTITCYVLASIVAIYLYNMPIIHIRSYYARLRPKASNIAIMHVHKQLYT